ncbi:MAG: hypothetical protein M1822_009619 [Bathelium mastoideum]|nr:MAG: hypothetical protein M1822_009619 [Bathelium mastoideum]
MAPHAESLSPTNPCPQPESDHYLEADHLNGALSNEFNGHSKATKNERSRLRYTKADELHDLICVGFGPASLAIAVALHDASDDATATKSLPALSGRRPKVAFLERQHQFAWHAGMILPGAKMQITFIKDLATLRNPKSEFTFLNYLHRKGRLVQFTNLGTFLPQRIEYEDYLRWCAGWFDEVVSYNQDVFEVNPRRSSTEGGTVDHFVVRSKDNASGTITERKAKHVVIAVGGKPNIPKPLPANHARIVHSAKYASSVPKLLPNTQGQYDVVIIGSGQSAAEVFHNLQKQYPNSRTRLVIRGSCLRPSDDSPFVNEIFDPERVDAFYHQSSATRSHSIAQDRCTNYGVVRLELLESIYSDLYTQRLKYSEEDQWQHRILNYSLVTGCEDLPDERVAVHIRDDRDHGKLNGAKVRDSILPADVVVVATGYRRDAHEDLLQSTRHLLPDQDRSLQVGRDYKVKFPEGTVSNDAGIWLQGCNENSHGLSDTLLSVLATRGGDMVQSLFGSQQVKVQHG